ncbi:MAG: hypothetical protein AB2L24_09910 [Mangrovibacterium sp.]
MKYTLLISVLALIAFSSCNKVMDTEPMDSYTSSDVWGNYSLSEGYMFTCYANIVGGYMISWNQDILTKEMLNQDWGGTYVSEKTEQLDKYTDEGWKQFWKHPVC